MKVLLITVIMLFNVNVLMSEETESDKSNDSGRVMFTLRTQYAVPNFSTLREANDRTMNFLPFAIKSTDDFPLRPVYKIDVNMLLSGNYLLSLGGFWHSTGSRIHYKDYSGEYRSDVIVSTMGFGVSGVRFSPLPIFQMELGVSIDLGHLKKKYVSKGYYRIADEISSGNKEEVENGFYFEPGIILVYRTSNYLFGLNISYMLDIKSSNDPWQEPIVSYDGLRLGLVFGLNSNIFK